MERSEVLQQKLEHWCAASVRAISKHSSLEYRGHVLTLDEKPLAIPAPHLHLDFSTTQSSKIRGVADGIALRFIYSNAKLHQELSPPEPIAKLVFDLLEQLRCESLAPQTLPGIRANLQRRFLFWAQQASASKLIESDVGLLLFSLNVVCWSRLMILPIPEQIEDVIEHTRWGFAESIGAPLRQLKLKTNDQVSFSKPALEIAKTIASMVRQSEDKAQDQKADEALQSFSGHKPLNYQWLGDDNDALKGGIGVTQANTLDGVAPDFQYQIFSTDFDRINEIGKLVRQPQLLKFRQQLDKQIRKQSVNVHRVARYLQQLVVSPTLSGWSFGEEQGYLDSGSLTRLLSSPNERRLFRQEQLKSKSDTVLSIVVDNSGSMTQQNPALAVLVDTLARAFELADIKTEVLGFTTGEWNGGKVAKQWAKAGKPEKPGRLNSLSHIVYKTAETPWRRSRTALAGLLRSDLFRESIDGEALQWAANRIEGRREKNKIILMLSDGSPMDTSTIAANHERILDQHLAQVAKSIEQRSDIKLCALGVGLDLSTYYQHCLAVDIEQQQTTKDYFAIVDLISRAV